MYVHSNLWNQPEQLVLSEGLSFASKTEGEQCYEDRSFLQCLYLCTSEMKKVMLSHTKFATDKYKQEETFTM